MEFVAFISKWVHLLSMIGMLGGTAFAWFILHPALKVRSEDPGIGSIWKKYGMLQGMLWVLVLVTGFYNYYLISQKPLMGAYHMFLGMKMMLAILMFLIAMIASHPIPALEKWTKNRGPWLFAIMAMGILVVGISAHVNMGRMSGQLKQQETITTSPLMPSAR